MRVAGFTTIFNMVSSIGKDSNLRGSGWWESAPEHHFMSGDASGEAAANPFVTAAKTPYGTQGVIPKGLAAACEVQEAALADARKEKGRKAVKERALMRTLSVMFADMHTDLAMWREVKAQLNDMAVFIDLSRFEQITALRLAYDQVEVARATEYDEELAARAELRVGKESVKEPKVGKAVMNGHVKWGKVKDSVGGRGAAIVTDTQQRPLKCFCFHDTPRRPCQDGVPAGHVSGQAGLCAYKH